MRPSLLLPAFALTSFALAGLMAGCQPAAQPEATLILHGGHIITPETPEATALAVAGDRILAVGPDTPILALQGPKTQVLDLDGATVVPGFNDSHCHLYGLGQALAQIDLVGTASPEDVAARVATAHAERPGDGWLQGRGWDQNDWPVQEYPTRALLDVVVGTRPVLIRRIDGHAALASSQALALAGITADTPDPDGGQILRDKAGRPTGLLIDNAVDLVLAIIPQPDADEVARRVRLAIDHCHRYGITGVHEAGVSWERVGYYQSLAQAGKLDLRIYAMLDDVPATLDAAFAQGPIFTPDDIFTARAVKIYADGALGSRGARLLADYTDQPGHRGLLVTDPAHLREVSRRARDKGFQVGAHAIGDAANRLLLNIFSELNKEDGSVRDPRWRIEHSQILHPEDIPRFAREGVIAAMQPVHCTSDMDWAEQRLGAQRLAGGYAWKSLLDSGARLCFGTDFPIEKVDPLDGLYAARTRMHPDGTPPGGWQPQEKLDGATALRLYTAGSAYAAFMEDRLGVIRPGYYADLTVLSGNPVTCPPAQLLDMAVRHTIVAGRVVYSAE
ncbi:amidohydrolase [bacterium DOLZORAL124_64_63]|nr:MAG: amidohydrolase [bacterium DOLZORAL124_64_63]